MKVDSGWRSAIWEMTDNNHLTSVTGHGHLELEAFRKAMNKYGDWSWVRTYKPSSPPLLYCAHSIVLRNYIKALHFQFL